MLFLRFGQTRQPDAGQTHFAACLRCKSVFTESKGWQGRNRLLKKGESYAKGPENHPSGPKDPLILRHLWHG
jgi:hypothetical protein